MGGEGGDTMGVGWPANMDHIVTYMHVYIYIYDPGLRFATPPTPHPPQCEDPHLKDHPS